MVARAFLQSAFSSALVLLLGVMTGSIAARALGPEDRGHLGIVFFWAGLLSVLATMSVGDAFLVTVRNHPGAETLRADARRLVRLAIGVCWPVGTVIIALAVEPYGGTFILMSTAFWSVQLVESCTTQLSFGFFKQDGRFLSINIIRVCLPATYLVLSAAVALAGGGVGGFVAAQAAALVLGMGLRGYLARERHPTAARSTRLNPELLRSALNFHGITIITTLSGIIDRFVVIQTSTASEIGIYLVAASVAGPAQAFLSVGIQSIALSFFTRRSDDLRAANARRLLRLTWVISLAGSAFAMAAAPIVVPILFGPAFRASGFLASALSLASALTAVRTSQIEILKSGGSGRDALWGEAIFMAAFVAAFASAYWLGSTWSVVWGLAAGHAAAATWLSAAIRADLPEVTARDWLIPRWSTIVEAYTLLRSALAIGQRRL